MAVVNGYTTVDVVKQALDIEASTEDDGNLEAAINAASREVDRLCGRRFWVDTSDRTVYLTPRHRKIVWFGPDPEAADLDTLTTLSESTDGIDFDPLTVDVDFYLSPRSGPHRKAVSTSGWPHVHDAVEVTGKFGIDGAPDDVKLATKMLATRLFKRSTEAPMGAGMVNMLDDRTFVRPSRWVDGDIEQLLRPHRILPVVV